MHNGRVLSTERQFFARSRIGSLKSTLHSLARIRNASKNAQRHARGPAHARRLHVSAVATTERASAGPGGKTEPSRSHETEVVVIGSGLGGLCCAAMLAKYGVKVTVCESHSIPGGAAHAWVRDGYHFESGPSLYSGMAGKGRGANPIAHVLAAIEEPLDLIEYNRWNVVLPEGTFLTEIGNDQFEDVLRKASPGGIPDWQELQRVMKPLAQAATLMPPVAFRADPFVAITTLGRYLPYMLQSGPDALKLLGPFENVMNPVVKDPFVRNWLNLLCFLLSGLPANGTIAAEVAFMFNEWYKPNACLEFPVGGSQALVAALIRGVKKNGGKVYLNAHVEQILVEGGRARGVRLKGGDIIRASKAVVSNASAWDTLLLVPPGIVPDRWRADVETIPVNRSFMHLHLGFDATGLDDLELHHIIVNSWEGGVDTEQNVVLISIPSVMDPKLAPAGKHTLHAYLPATEPYGIWEGLERGSPEYETLKRERSEVLWRGVERVIPDIRKRVEIEMVGTPLTHKRFLRRYKGTYGPGIMAGKGTFPGPTTPVPGLLAVGDSTFPGIGVPAVAASGAIAANSLVGVQKHWQLLDAIGA